MRIFDVRRFEKSSTHYDRKLFIHMISVQMFLFPCFWNCIRPWQHISPCICLLIMMQKLPSQSVCDILVRSDFSLNSLTATTASSVNYLQK